jgi:hypothetical protein
LGFFGTRNVEGPSLTTPAGAAEPSGSDAA